ncbi:MAG TPA: hypothetical protein VHZ04_01845 [Candidatus Paceibacterota bacterium]|jgi:hypothetical protein|nr:hypothetical protein [Candidatus Paceibacterota bacterium]
MVLGVDCGDVIFYTWGGSVPGSLANLREIAASGRFKEIHIVSKAHPITRAIFLARLKALDFWNSTGIPRSNLHFCMRYEDKAAICADLAVTHFVDDRLQVLNTLTTVPNRYALREGGPRAEEAEKYKAAYDAVTRVNSWEELRQLL